jgi:MSHA biogenesis protein MshI
VAISIPWLNKKRISSGRIGITVGPDGLSVAHVDKNKKLTFCRLYDQLGDNNQLLSDLVAEHDWNGVLCSVVLHPVYYQLLLTECPPVEDDELSSAVRWKIKELLDFPIETAAIESFILPDDAYRGRQKMLYAAALRQSTLQELVSPIEAAGFAVDCIEVSELALHNLTSRMPLDRGCTAIVQFHAGEGFINLTESGEIYLSRRLDIGLDKFKPGSDNTAFFDTLFLEIQRSLDFYESQLGKGIVTHLYYSPGLVSTETIGNFLSSQLAVTVEPLSFLNLDLSSDIPLDSDQVVRCAIAIGAALQPKKALEAANATH